MKLPLLRRMWSRLTPTCPAATASTRSPPSASPSATPGGLLSTSAPHAAASTVDALSLGANDYVMKPEAASDHEAIAQLCGDLLSWIDECCPIPTVSPITVTHPNASSPSTPHRRGGDRHFDRRPGALMELIRCSRRIFRCDPDRPAHAADVHETAG